MQALSDHALSILQSLSEAGGYIERNQDTATVVVLNGSYYDPSAEVLEEKEEPFSEDMLPFLKKVWEDDCTQHFILNGKKTD